MLKRHYLICIISMLLGSALYANDAGDWLEIAPDARSAAMGNAQVAQANGAYSAYWNSAALGEKTEVDSSVASLFGEVNYQGLGYRQTTKWGKMGLSYLTVGITGFQYAELINNRPSALYGKFSVTNSGLLVSYAPRIFDSLLLGGTAKFICSTIANNQASAIGFDFGWQTRVNSKIVFGGSIYNLAPPSLMWSNGTNEVYATRVKVGLSYSSLNGLNLEADLDLTGYSQSWIHAGGEYWFNQFLAVRIGYDKNVPTLGLGIAYSGLQLDFAYAIPVDDVLSASSRFSLSWAQ